jgi:hypothetical protein
MQAIYRVHKALPLCLSCVPEKMDINKRHIYIENDTLIRYNGIRMG